MTLEEKRQEIQKIDEAIMELFVKRMQAVSEVAEIKRQSSTAIADPEYENEKLQELLALVTEEYRSYALSLCTSLFKISRQYQSDLIGG